MKEKDLTYRSFLSRRYVMEMITEKEYKLPCPSQCPAKFYNKSILPCIQTRPDDRPTFSELVVELRELAGTYVAPPTVGREARPRSRNRNREPEQSSFGSAQSTGSHFESPFLRRFQSAQSTTSGYEYVDKATMLEQKRRSPRSNMSLRGLGSPPSAYSVYSTT